MQAVGSLYRTYLSKVFDPISKMSFYVFVSKPSPRMTLQEMSSGGSCGNFVPQLGPFASKPASTRRKGTQTNQNINKLGSLLIIVAMRLAIIFFAIIFRPSVGQTNFGGGSQNSNPSSDVNTRLFTGICILTCYIFSAL